jgi:hypothetical protein
MRFFAFAASSRAYVRSARCGASSSTISAGIARPVAGSVRMPTCSVPLICRRPGSIGSTSSRDLSSEIASVVGGRSSASDSSSSPSVAGSGESRNRPFGAGDWRTM